MQEINDNLRALYQKGLNAIQSQNWDYAITLFTAIIESEPFYSPARTNLRIAEFRNFENYKFQIWKKINSYLFGIIPYTKYKIYLHKNNWLAALNELEKILKIYPKNTRMLKKLADLAEKANLLETACGIYETIYLLNPIDISTLKNLGKYYHLLDQLDKAHLYYERALAIAPLDYGARKGFQDLAAIGTIAKGWEDTGTYRSKIKDESQAQLFEKESKIVRSSEDELIIIKDLEKRLSEQPGNISLIKQLASLYISINEYDKALKLYEMVKSPDPDIRKEMFNIKILKLKDTPELKDKLILEETEARVKDFPTHLPLRYELGTVYLKHSMIDKAIGEFQLSIKDPKFRLLSLNNLGLCFFKKGLFDLAVNQFQKAISELHEWDELKKEVIYNLGTTYEAMGDKIRAIAEYKKIYEQDIHFRDIVKKIS